MVNLDIIGSRGYAGMRAARSHRSEPDPDYAAAFYSGASPRLRDILRGARDIGDLKLDLEPVNRFPFSDAGSFQNIQVPTISLFSGFHPDYSSLSDTPDKLDYRKLARMVLLTDRILVNLIEEPAPIGFDPSIHVTGGMKY